MFMFVVACVVLGFYALCNVAVVLLYTPKSLARGLWVEQKWFGKIAANIFYAPAWVLMGIMMGCVFCAYWVVRGIAISSWWLASRMFNGYTKAIRWEL